MSLSMVMSTGVALEMQNSLNQAKQLVTTMENAEREAGAQNFNSKVLSKAEESKIFTETSAQVGGSVVRASSEVVNAYK